MRGIITADWHIRATRPRCRADADWMETQRMALKQVADIAERYHTSVYCVGDVFHSNSDASFECVKLVQDFSNRLCSFGVTLGVLAGNHDLPYHSSENLKKSAIGVLLNSYNIGYITDSVLDESQADISAGNFDEETVDCRFIFKHVLTIPKEDKPDYVDSETPESLLEKYPSAEWIFTGDYHKAFHYDKKGRHVINPGCLLRQVADMKDYQCGVYYVDTDKNIVELVPIIDEGELVDDSYLVQEGERETRIGEFVDKLKETDAVSFDFADNVEKAMLANGINGGLREAVEELMNESS